jgi:hypothetical protein
MTSSILILMTRNIFMVDHSSGVVQGACLGSFAYCFVGSESHLAHGYIQFFYVSAFVLSFVGTGPGMTDRLSFNYL